MADVCPERAIPLQSTFAFGETEVYVPLFLLPEEIVRVEGLECGLSIARGGKKSDCWNGEFTDRDPLSKASEVMRACYVNFANPVEYKPWAFEARQASMRRFFHTQEQLYAVLKGSNGIETVRSGFEAVEGKRARDSNSIFQNIWSF